MDTVRSWLGHATTKLTSAGVASARLDAELLLADSLAVDRTWLHAHGEHSLTTAQSSSAHAHLARRLAREPLAYIVGYREFYGHKFTVTPATLVPRPESEIAIELLQKYIKPTSKRLIDIGTGSGCIGISAKLEFPELDVTLSDISRQALAVARRNAIDLNARVTAIEADLFDGNPGRYDIVVANLPYVDRTWSGLSPEIAHEPGQALYAEQSGLAVIKRLIDQIASHLNPNGLLLIESDPIQHQPIIEHAKIKQPNLKKLASVDYYLVFCLQQVAAK